MKRFFITLLILLSQSLGAQTLNQDGTLFTVGRTIDADGTLHNYIVWQPGDAANTFGKDFGIYRKAGSIASPASYQRLATQSLQTSPSTIFALLNLGNSFDYDAANLPGRIGALHAESMSLPAPNPPTNDLTIQRARELSEMMAVAEDDPEIIDRLFFLGRAHPGVMLTLGHAFQIEVNPGSVWTYEIRELNSGGSDLRVIGRVTLDAANPLALTAPGAPVPVYHPLNPGTQLIVSPKDHLVGRFRWANETVDPIEPTHTFGYNLYRVEKTLAENSGWDVPGSQPDASVLDMMAQTPMDPADPEVFRANVFPIITTGLLDNAAANDLSNTDTFFFGDDIRARPGGTPIPFEDGDSYYYFVAARDLAGHPGPLSNGTLFTFCSRIAPLPPLILGVDNTFTASTIPSEQADLKGEQHFKLRIRPHEDDDEGNFAYHIYRWEYAQQAIEQGGSPSFNLVGSTVRNPLKNIIEWEDTGSGAPSINDGDDFWAGKVVWYTVRVEDDTACTPKNLSLHSPPASGVLRDWADPGAPTGTLENCVYEPFGTFEGQVFKQRADLGISQTQEGFVVRVERESPVITEYALTVLTDAGNQVFFDSGFFPYNSDFVTVLVPRDQPSSLRVELVGITSSGLTSAPVDGVRNAETGTGTLIDCLEFSLSLSKNCDPAPGGSNTELHEPVGLLGEISGVTGTLILPLGTWEYRIYRRVGEDGPLELIDSGSGPSIPSTINWEDLATPTVNGTEVCFYGQVFDQNGNGGPLTLIECIEILNADLPTPLLSDPVALPAEGNNARLRLNWFCDPVGVERFVIWVGSDSGTISELSAAGLSPAIDTAQTLPVPEVAADIAFTPLQTGSVSGSFGPGPEFEAVLTVPTSGQLFFVVQAVGKGAVGSRVVGELSNLVSGTWIQPQDESGPIIPWPQRGLSGLQGVTRPVIEYADGEGPLYAFEPPDNFQASGAILLGTFNTPYTDVPDLPEYGVRLPRVENPEDIIFFSVRRNAASPESATSLLPFIVYRYQLESDAYPNAVPNLVQVSPLIDRIAYKQDTDKNTSIPITDIRDPLLYFTRDSATPRLPFAGDYSRTNPGILDFPNSPTLPVPPYLQNKNTFVYWRDLQPATRGAKYQYLIVRMTETGEVDRVIPVNSVEH